MCCLFWFLVRTFLVPEIVPTVASAPEDPDRDRLLNELFISNRDLVRLRNTHDRLNQSYSLVVSQGEHTRAMLQAEIAELKAKLEQKDKDITEISVQFKNYIDKNNEDVKYWMCRCEQLEKELYEISMTYTQQSADCWSHETSPEREFDSE